MAQIYVNSGLVKPKSIHIWNSSARLWENNKIGHVRVNGVWVPFIQYESMLYDNGVEYELFETIPYPSSGETFDRLASSFILGATGVSNATRASVIYTVSAIDITNYKTLNIEFSSSMARASGGQIEYGVGINKGYNLAKNSHFVNSSTVGTEIVLPRQVRTVDISSLTGVHYINFGVYLSAGDLGTLSTVIHKIWLE